MKMNCVNYERGLADWLDKILVEIKQTPNKTIKAFAININIDERQLRGLARQGFRWKFEELLVICKELNIKPSTVLWNIEMAIENGVIFPPPRKKSSKT